MRDDDGPAFPVVSYQGACNSQGMTLRDYFAAAALDLTQFACDGDECNADKHANTAYKIADAMLAERAKRE